MFGVLLFVHVAVWFAVSQWVYEDLGGWVEDWGTLVHLSDSEDEWTSSMEARLCSRQVRWVNFLNSTIGADSGWRWRHEDREDKEKIVHSTSVSLLVLSRGGLACFLAICCCLCRTDCCGVSGVLVYNHILLVLSIGKFGCFPHYIYQEVEMMLVASCSLLKMRTSDVVLFRLNCALE